MYASPFSTPIWLYIIFIWLSASATSESDKGLKYTIQQIKNAITITIGHNIFFFIHNISKFRVVELSRVYHTIPQSASKTKRTTDRSRWFLSSGGGWSIRNFTSQAPASFRSALVGACLLQTLPGTSAANCKLSA